MKLNDNGDLVKSPGIEVTEIGLVQTPEMVIATAAELKAAGLANGGTVSVERPQAAIDNLREHQEQLDQDGVFVGVSRQAIDEVLAYLDRTAIGEQT